MSGAVAWSQTGRKRTARFRLISFRSAPELPHPPEGLIPVRDALLTLEPYPGGCLLRRQETLSGIRPICIDLERITAVVVSS